MKKQQQITKDPQLSREQKNQTKRQLPKEKETKRQRLPQPENQTAAHQQMLKKKEKMPIEDKNNKVTEIFKPTNFLVVFSTSCFKWLKLLGKNIAQFSNVQHAFCPRRARENSGIVYLEIDS